MDGTSQKSTGLEEFDIFTRLRKRVETILGQIQAKKQPFQLPTQKNLGHPGIVNFTPTRCQQLYSFHKAGRAPHIGFEEALLGSGPGGDDFDGPWHLRNHVFYYHVY